jgi:hypothetical protein
MSGRLAGSDLQTKRPLVRSRPVGNLVVKKVVDENPPRSANGEVSESSSTAGIMMKDTQ